MLETRSLALYAVLLAASSSLSLGQVDLLCNDTSLDQCDLCINSSPQCTWCPLLPEENQLLLDMFPEYVSVRCRDPTSFPMECSNSSVLQGSEQVLMSSQNKTQNLPLSRDVLDLPLNQVTPQNVVIKLRKGDTESFNMSFISLRNTPLDVYFLADVSASLANTIQSLRDDIVQIAEELKNISTAFAIGFGSFVDKNTLPYAMDNYELYTNNFKNETVCASSNECVPTYSFHHSITLTSNVSHFENVLPNVSRISSNVDAPEGSLDALLQVAMCSNVIGWREDALKMVFLVTDQNYHIAGDGKIAGIVQPNDGRCNLAKIPDNRFGEYEYTRPLVQDYVSAWQIRDALQQNRIIPTFVLQFDGRFGPPPQSLTQAYQSLRADLTAIGAQVLTIDSRNSTSATRDLISVIQTAYNRTVQDVSVAIPTDVDGYHFNITPVDGCERMNDETGACLVDFDNIVTFSVSVTLDDCAKAKELRVRLSGRAYQFTAIDLEPICSCPCSEPDQHITNSTVCTMGQGDQVCGVCECDDPYSGPECQCEQLGNCRSDDYCNGFECDACGFCVCNETTFGERCECDILQNFCPGRGINEVTGLEEVCSGHGTCVCESNKCECETAPLSGFKYFGLGTTSSDGLNGGCECNPDGCYNPTFPVGLCYNQVEESYNNNQCTCGGCNCPPPFFAVDNTCIDLDTLCDQLDDCVLCFLNNPCPNEPCSVPNDCSSYCVNKTFEQLEVDQIIPDRYSFDICSLEYEDCTVEFFFSTNEVDPVLISNSEDYLCFTTILPWIVAGSAVGAILLVGLIALIILKVCLMVLDRVEYKRFIQEMEGADFAPHENPLYITPKKEYVNPIRRVRVPQTSSTVKHDVVHRR